jgi:hypothetical protein
MPAPKILAVKITEESYPLAVACLPDDFRSIHPPRTYGNYLILNDRETVYFHGKATETKLVNSVVDEEQLNRYYDVVEMGLGLTFTEVTHKSEEDSQNLQPL